MNQQEQQFELARLAKTLRQVQIQIQKNKEVSGCHQHALRNSLQDYWNSSGGSSIDEAQHVETMNRQRALSKHSQGTARHLIKMLKSPYFGRIDFSEAHYNDTEKIYIGIGSLAGEDGEFLVYDWRAPVSSMFYDYGLGDAAYTCPAGEINGTITLKRQYKIADGHIQYMFDSDLTIDDDILQELLAKSVNEKMHTIVNSIQRDQNQIIRDEQHKVLFLAGPAGSGKTSVALHRIAFLLYQNREKLTSQNVLILSPNSIFSDYISNVLPEIGEANVVQMTFQDYTARSAAHIPLRLETRADYFEHMLVANANKQRAVTISFKSSQLFNEVLTNYLNWLAADWINEHPSITARGETLFDQSEWQHYYQNSFRMMPPAIRLEKIRTIIQKRMHDLIADVRREKLAQLTEAGEEVNEKVIKALARIQARSELKPITDYVEKLTTLDALEEYAALFSDDRLFTVTNTPIPGNWVTIKSQTHKLISRGILPYEDISPFLYFQGVVQGFPVKQDIKHVVIDEAQDYSAFQYKILAQLFPNSSWTIVGDPAQSIQPFVNTASFTEASNILGQEQTLHFCLTKSYRSTQAIQAFCQAILPSAGKSLSINRPGPKPTVVQLSNSEDEAATLLSLIQTVQNEGLKSIGIITKNVTQALRIYSQLKGTAKTTLLIKDDDKFSTGIVIIPSYLAKGLEFDAVLIVNADATNYSQEQDGNILYTICTRALHRLYLFYTGSLSPYLRRVDKSLYNVSG
ncbi:Helicase IV [Sporomusa ovata DSM 2662]|uniref:ATP-dependent DNA helicase rep n=1 Tax=Sporomusa ovata TaxID=2378 RepID=A0A0U1KX06_9FIRM|nr:UvrD-helicase domain-containing protein [Sporomusa ovata]EQB28253.1 helicase IV [Sporomusa ovata DSM 2662]CQR71795.1 ATP-dependent DNA helicase rep [Sporomusa ovata]